MAVNITVSKALGGAFPTDSLQGGGLGYDFGDSEGGSSSGINNFYIVHDGIDEITNLAVNLQNFTDTYGGDYSPSADVAKLVAQGDELASDSGLYADQDGTKGVSDTFDQDWVFKTGTGDLFTSRKVIPADSMVYNNAGTLIAAITPATGTVGSSGNTTLGDTCHFRLRHRLKTVDTGTGVRQFGLYFSFNFTS